MDNQQTSHLPKEKFVWRIENFSKLKSKKLYSETFIMGGYPWRILIFPKGNNVDSLSLYLDVADSRSLPHGWSRYARFSLAVINQLKGKYTVEKETQHCFNSKESDWGFTTFMTLSELHDPNKGYIVGDTCIINAGISNPQSEKENQVDQAFGPTSAESRDKAGHMEVKEQEGKSSPLSAPVSSVHAQHTGNPSLPAGLTSNPMDELSDFRGLGKIESIFVPLLEEICSKHPSLIECQQKRSRQFVEWAFTALGRVLHFLKSKRVKDMNDETCEHLQILWEELETFRFDLTWLEPHVHSALGMKNYLEKATQVKKLKDNVSSLEMEMKRLKAKLASAEIDLEIAKRDLVQAEEGFQERDLDAELGYGRP
ncbi:MATH domain and coiled-coil domain-containing protein At3g58270-like [Neltuma alba]|uniref:MATH domain and coiled-coil domain-containing protein At3g58270-like n=1 Tax=Neltuma alba TaxID=207710 RepID=UPI0010A403DA|nr:MATH domain and coiled-coil domain-containing protein At3g58270-like [Prosopis alba]XP_028777637.1 MATH domain and coiled-coil domain-containing protein At3g58270-like [Prosopis alba]